MEQGYLSRLCCCLCCILIHISSASCSCFQQIEELQGQPCTGNGNRRLAYCYQIRFIPLLRIAVVLLLNKYISFLQPNVIYVAVPSPPRLRSQLKDGTRHLANDTSVCVNTPRVPSVHLPAVSGLAAEAESQRDCCLVTVTMDATLRRGLRCNGFRLNCWIWSWQRGS